jgi:DNA-binding NarL/FixJ family response regulator
MAARILVADDHEIVREGIRTLLGRSGREWEICGEATNGQEAVEMAAALKPDIIVLDVTMPVLSGLEAATQITKKGVGCRILIFTMHESDRLVVDVQSCGAHGYVAKSQAARDLVRAIETLLSGRTFHGDEVEDEHEKSERKKPGPTLCRSLNSRNSKTGIFGLNFSGPEFAF